MIKKRALCILLSAVLTLSLLPLPVFAAPGPAAIASGTTAIDDPVKTALGTGGNYYFAISDYIYYGTNNGTPIRWQVLNADKTNANGSGMFLMTDTLIGNSSGGDIKFDADGEANTAGANPNQYQGSDVQAWCQQFAADSFTAAEQAALLAVSKADKAESVLGLSVLESQLQGDKVFFLSAREVNDYISNVEGVRLKAKYGGSYKTWLLRSPYKSWTNYSTAISSMGNLNYNKVTTSAFARPGTNLDTRQILFTSAATGGKSATGTDGSLTAVPQYTGNEWKLTLRDEDRSGFSIQVQADGSIVYQNAITGSNEYISALVMDDATGQVLYYGRLKQLDGPQQASGTVQLDTSGIDMASCSLYIFNEQYNGDKMTDYASDLQLYVQPGVKYDISFNANGGSGQMQPVPDVEGSYTLPQCTFTAPSGMQFVAWAAGSPSGAQYAPGKQYTGKADTVFYAVWEQIHTYQLTPDTDQLYYGSSYQDPYYVYPQQVVITNTGNQTLSLSLPTAQNFDITGIAQGDILAPGDQVEITIIPFGDVAPGEYSEQITIQANGGATATITAHMTVLERPVYTFAGHEWWVIGQGEQGVTSPDDDTLTLLAKNNEFGITPFRQSAANDQAGYTYYGRPGGGAEQYYRNNEDGMQPWATPNEYMGSDLQQAMEHIAATIPEQEQSLIVPRDLTAAEGILDQPATGQTVWSITANEREKINSTNVWGMNNKAVSWWTSTGAGDSSVDLGNSAIVNSAYGIAAVSSWFVGSDTVVARPAVYVNIKDALFTTPADATGKSAAQVGGPVIANSTAGKTQKISTVDQGLTLTVGATQSQATQTGDTLTFSYKNASVGQNQYIACAFLDTQGNAVYYGRLTATQNSDAQQGTLQLPLAGVANGTYVVALFFETANGDMYTDFISQPTYVGVTVDNGVGTVFDFTGEEIIEYAQQPALEPLQDAQYTLGDTATALQVTATVTNGGTLTYQWYCSTTPDTASGVKIVGATGSSCVPATNIAGTMYYYCVVTNTNQKATIQQTAIATTNVAMVQVNKPDITAPNTGDKGTGLPVLALAAAGGVALLRRKKQRS